jgi:hypothetical protein
MTDENDLSKIENIQEMTINVVHVNPKEGYDLTEDLGVKKWEVPLPA